MFIQVLSSKFNRKPASNHRLTVLFYLLHTLDRREVFDCSFMLSTQTPRCFQFKLVTYNRFKLTVKDPFSYYTRLILSKYSINYLTYYVMYMHYKLRCFWARCYDLFTSQNFEYLIIILCFSVFLN